MKKGFFAGVKLGVAMLAMSSSMFAVSIFSDAFPDSGANEEFQGLGLTNGTMDLRNWDVLAGSVDVLDTFLGVNCGSPSGKRCVDINGSSTVTGKIQTTQTFNFLANHTYTLTLWVAGSQRSNSATDVLGVSLGSLTSTVVTKAFSAGWTLVTLSAVGNGTTGRITLDGGVNGVDADNIGVVLDDINLDDTLNSDPIADSPEPATFALLGAGLAVLGLRRRK